MSYYKTLKIEKLSIGPTHDSLVRLELGAWFVPDKYHALVIYGCEIPRIEESKPITKTNHKIHGGP